MESDQWHRWTFRKACDRPDLARAVHDFSAPYVAGQAAAAWLKTDAPMDQACATYILLREGVVVAFYGILSAHLDIHAGVEGDLSARAERRRTHGLKDGHLPASHLKWMARHEDYKGVGTLAVKHATWIADEVRGFQGNMALTLDPFDEKTRNMWRDRYGFRDSGTHGDSGLTRMYLPLPSKPI